MRAFPDFDEKTSTISLQKWRSRNHTEVLSNGLFDFETNLPTQHIHIV